MGHWSRIDGDEPMKAIILGAGYGTRLYPLTRNKPKPLLTVGGKTILERILEKVDEVSELDHVLVVTNDKFTSHFEAWKRELRWSKPIEIINDGTTSNENRLGAVGDIYFAVKQRDLDEEILVVGGDNVFEFDLKKAWGFFQEKASSVVGLYDMVDKAKVAGLYGVVSINEEAKIEAFEEKPKKPKSALISTAVYFLTREDLAELRRYIEEGNSPDNLGDFIRYLITDRNIYGYVFRENWFDIGSFEQLEGADAHFSKASP